MIVSIHQPDLLPYSGFWFKMINSDAFVIARHDQFQKHGYQRRVTMRDSWCSLELEGKPSLVSITSVQVRTGWQDRLSAAIAGRYTGAKYWKTRGVGLLDQIQTRNGATLDEVNLSLIYLMRNMLDIRTPLAFTDPPRTSGLSRLVEQVQAVSGTVYLSGSGGRSYLGEDAPRQFAEAGVELQWSQHHVTTGDSIVSVLMDYDDPLEVISRVSTSEADSDAFNGRS